jgi:hypothetical protein
LGVWWLPCREAPLPHPSFSYISPKPHGQHPPPSLSLGTGYVLVCARAGIVRGYGPRKPEKWYLVINQPEPFLAVTATPNDSFAAGQGGACPSRKSSAAETQSPPATCYVASHVTDPDSCRAT